MERGLGFLSYLVDFKEGLKQYKEFESVEKPEKPEVL